MIPLRISCSCRAISANRFSRDEPGCCGIHMGRNGAGRAEQTPGRALAGSGRYLALQVLMIGHWGSRHAAGIIGEAARKPPVLTGGGIASLTFCTYHLYSAVLGYTLRSLLPIRDRQYRYSKMVTTGDHTSKHHAILDVRRTTV